MKSGLELRNRFLPSPDRLAWHWSLGCLCTFLAAGAAQAQNTLLWSTNYYLVQGNSTEELHASMHASKPWKDKADMASLVGLTTWHIDWKFHVAPTPEGCRCTSFTTRTAITNTLPRWLPPTNSASELRLAWARFATGLAQHENGHARLALDAVAEMHRQVKALPEDLDCADLRRRINDTAKRILDEFRKRDESYDRATQHGATQGASLIHPLRGPGRN